MSVILLLIWIIDMEFYTEFYRLVRRQEKYDFGKVAFFVLRLISSSFLLYFYTDYFIYAFLLYRLILTSIMYIKNNIYLSQNDFIFSGFTQNNFSFLKFFLFQRLIINNIFYKIAYSILFFGILLYLDNLSALSNIIIIDIIAIFLEWLIIKNNKLSEELVNIKILSEVTVLMIVIVFLIVFYPNNLSFLFAKNSLLPMIIAILYSSYTWLFIRFFSQRKYSDKQGLIRLLYGRISIFDYKEIKLFHRGLVVNFFNMMLAVGFFLWSDFQSSTEMIWLVVIYLISVAMVFTQKVNGRVVNFKHDNFFLNNKLLSIQDYKMILNKKLQFYIKYSLVVKTLLMLGISIILNYYSLNYFIIALLLSFVCSLQEFNLLIVKERFSILQILTIRYFFCLVIFLSIYTRHYFLLVIVLSIFILSELINIRKIVQEEELI